MLLDTSGLLCIHHRSEAYHHEASTFFRTARIRLTHNYVLAEFVPLCQVRKLHRGAALDFAVDLIASSEAVEVIWVDDMLHRAALALLQSQRDKAYSLCDAVSFLVMHEYGVTDALTTDHHFEQAGFRRLLKS